jgi:hypothetical protein
MDAVPASTLPSPSPAAVNALNERNTDTLCLIIYDKNRQVALIASELAAGLDQHNDY